MRDTASRERSPAGEIPQINVRAIFPSDATLKEARAEIERRLKGLNAEVEITEVIFHPSK